MLAAIRPALPADAADLATLAVQLGYPVQVAQVGERLPPISFSPDAVLLVATGAAGEVIGWIHAELKRSLLGPLAAQVMGLVVSEAQRSQGVGAALLEAAEAWASERGCSLVLVGTRVTRERAHEFYRRRGYRLLKTSHFFEKELA